MTSGLRGCVAAERTARGGVRTAGSRLAGVGVALALAAAGCAMGSRSMPGAAKSVADPGSELAALEGEIARARHALGLPPRPRREVVGGREGAQDGATSLKAEPPAREPGPSASVEAAESGEGAAGQKAPDLCRHTRAICHAARRICGLADYLGEADARGRCRRAQEDCTEARRHTGCAGR